MGEQRNLTEENVEEWRAELDRTQKENPDLEYRFFEQTEESDAQNKQLTLKTVFDKIVSLEQKLTFIFGDHILIDGEWIKAKAREQCAERMHVEKRWEEK